MTVSKTLSSLVLPSGAVAVTNATAASSTITGALVVSGGVGVGGNLYAGALFDSGARVITTATSVAVTITDDTTTNASRYIVWEDVLSGSMTTVGVSSTKLYFNPSSGTLNATTFNSLSDESYKENITTLVDSLNIVNRLDGVSFDWKDTGRKSYGVIAQELEKIVPELVDGTDKKTVNYSGIIAFLINAVKELDTRIKLLEGNL